MMPTGLPAAGMEMRENATAEVESDPAAERRRRMLAQMLAGGGQGGGQANWGTALNSAIQTFAPMAVSAFSPAQGGMKTLGG